MILFFISLLVGSLSAFLLHSVFVAFITFADLKWRDWVTLQPYRHWLKEFKEMFDLMLFMIMTILLSFLWLLFVALASFMDYTRRDESGHCECGFNCYQEGC